MSKQLVDYGNGLVGPDPVAESQEKAASERLNADAIRVRAAELEGSGVSWTGSHKRGAAKRPVRIKMPSGQVIEVGGEILVTALANGGHPVE